MRHVLGTPTTVISFGAFPSVFNQPPLDLNTKTWATIDLHEPSRIDLAMTAYNVGQLQIVADGGQGEEKDFAKLTFRNDIICLTEEMNDAERDETVVALNDLRSAEGLDLLKPVYPGNGDPPNNMLLVAGPIIESDFVLFGDLPEVKTFCAAETDGDPFSNGDCTGDGAGYKGIVWARVGVKKSTAAPKGGKMPDGIMVPVSWHDSFDLWGGDKFRAGVYVKDHDVGPNDLYDTSDYGSGFRGPHFEFDHAYPGTFRLIGNFLDAPGTGRLLGTADVSTGDPDGSCVLGCLGIVTVGDGDVPGYDAMVIQNLLIEELP